jgi:hypothetical protein
MSNDALAADEDAVFDDIDRHMTGAGSIDRAAGPLGVYLAWCANLGLLAEAFATAHERELVRLKMRDMRPGEFLIRAAAGTLRFADLNEVGSEFTRRYYQRYVGDYAEALEVAPEAIYEQADTWENYDRVAPGLTRQLYRPADHERSWMGVLMQRWRGRRGRHDG